MRSEATLPQSTSGELDDISRDTSYTILTAFETEAKLVSDVK